MKWHNLRRIIRYSVLICALFCAQYSTAAILENTGIPIGGTTALTGANLMCKRITNNSPTGKTVYVPGNTADEWASFVNKPPSGVSSAECTCAPRGVVSPLFSATAFDGDGYACGSYTCTNLSAPYADGTYMYVAGWNVLHALRYVNGTWQNVGSYAVSSSTQIQYISGDGTYIYIAGNDHTVYSSMWTGFVKALRFTGSGFQVVASVPQGTNLPSMHASGGKIFVSFSAGNGSTAEYRYVYSFNGSAFTLVAADVFNSDAYGGASIGLWSTHGKTALSWRLFTYGVPLFVYNGANTTYFGDLGGPGASGGTASNGLVSSDVGTPIDFQSYILAPVASHINAYRLNASGGLDYFAIFYNPSGAKFTSLTTDGTYVYAATGDTTQERVLVLTFDGSQFAEVGAVRLPDTQGFGSRALSLAYGGGKIYAVQNGVGTYAMSFSCAPTSSVPQCSDGIDNNGNGAVDTADTCSCSSAGDTLEADDGVLCVPPPPDPVYYGSVICTELHRQGYLKNEWYAADERFGARMPSLVMAGYHAWARPIVSLMQWSPKATAVVRFLATPWAQEMAYIEGEAPHGSIIGLIEMVIGIPISAAIGLVAIWIL